MSVPLRSYLGDPTGEEVSNRWSAHKAAKLKDKRNGTLPRNFWAKRNSTLAAASERQSDSLIMPADPPAAPPSVAFQEPPPMTAPVASPSPPLPAVPPPAVQSMPSVVNAVLCPLVLGYRISSSPDHGAHPTRHFNGELTLSIWHARLPIDVDYGDDCMIEAASNVKNAQLLDRPQSWWAKDVPHVRAARAASRRFEPPRYHSVCSRTVGYPVPL